MGEEQTDRLARALMDAATVTAGGHHDLVEMMKVLGRHGFVLVDVREAAQLLGLEPPADEGRDQDG
jgi:hypothetical protein